LTVLAPSFLRVSPSTDPDTSVAQPPDECVLSVFANVRTLQLHQKAAYEREDSCGVSATKLLYAMGIRREESRVQRDSEAVSCSGSDDAGWTRGNVWEQSRENKSIRVADELHVLMRPWTAAAANNSEVLECRFVSHDLLFWQCTL